MMCRLFVVVLGLVVMGVLSGFARSQDVEAGAKRGVVELFEDEAEAMLKVLTNPGDAGGNGETEGQVVFSGTKAIKITQYQRFSSPGAGVEFSPSGRSQSRAIPLPAIRVESGGGQLPDGDTRRCARLEHPLYGRPQPIRLGDPVCRGQAPARGPW